MKETGISDPQENVLYCWFWHQLFIFQFQDGSELKSDCVNYYKASVISSPHSPLRSCK